MWSYTVTNTVLKRIRLYHCNSQKYCLEKGQPNTKYLAKEREEGAIPFIARPGYGTGRYRLSVLLSLSFVVLRFTRTF